MQKLLTNIKLNWPFLLFLIGVTYVKFYIKVAAVVFYACYILYKKYKLAKPIHFQWFYLLIICIGCISSVANQSFYNSDYSFGFSLGILQWGVCLVASYLVYVSALNIDRGDLLNVLKTFFAINVAISFITLFFLFIEAGFSIPYWHNDGGKFGVSTGDHINGVFSDNSVTNAAISALGTLYFLYNKEFRWAILCCITMLLCTSNVTVIFLAAILGVVLITKKDLQVKKYAALLIFLMIISYPILSPQNLKYIEVVYEREQKDDYNIGLDKLAERKISITPEIKQKDFFKKDVVSAFKVEGFGNQIRAYKYYPYKKDVVKPVFNKKEFYANIGTYKMQLKQQALINVGGELIVLEEEATEKNEDDAQELLHVALNPFSVQKAIGNWYKTPANQSALVDYNMPGKIYTNMQTLYFLRSSPTHLFLGAGIGNFSSKLAIKMTGLGLQGSYPKDKTYVSLDFLQYHFYTLLFYLSRHAAEHSVMNMPNSTYNQIAGEYGLLGLLIFIVFYIGFVIKSRHKTKIGLYSAALLFMFLGMEYWFELISLVVVFELMFTSEIFAKTKHEQS